MEDSTSNFGLVHSRTSSRRTSRTKSCDALLLTNMDWGCVETSKSILQSTSMFVKWGSNLNSLAVQNHMDQVGLKHNHASTWVEDALKPLVPTLERCFGPQATASSTWNMPRKISTTKSSFKNPTSQHGFGNFETTSSKLKMACWSSNFGHEDLRTHMGSNFGVRNEPIHYDLKQPKISWTRLHGLVLTLKMKMKNIRNLWIQTRNVEIGLWAQMRGLNGLVGILGLGTWLAASSQRHAISHERDYLQEFGLHVEDDEHQKPLNQRSKVWTWPGLANSSARPFEAILTSNSWGNTCQGC